MKPFLFSCALLCTAVALPESSDNAPTLEKLKDEHTTWTVWWKETVTRTHQSSGLLVVPPSWGHPWAHPWTAFKETRGTYQSSAPKLFSETFKGRLVSYEGNEVKLEHIQRWRQVRGKWQWVEVGDGTFRSNNLSDADQRFLKKWRKAEKEPAGELALGELPQGDEGPFPRPAPDALTKAEEKARDVYKGDLAKANKPADKAALATTLLTAADSVGQDDASRLVLLMMARDLAVDAEDSRLAVKAVAALVGRFDPDGPSDAKEQIELGNAPWTEAEKAPAGERLRLKIEAAEWYLRAQPAATGLDKLMIEKRLAELDLKPEAKPEAKPAAAVKLPEGWVTVVNRKTGVGIWAPGSNVAWGRGSIVVRIEASGDYYKIRGQSPGTYLALKDWAAEGKKRGPRGPRGALQFVSDAGDKSTFWKFEPLADGYWRIVNRETAQCFASPDQNGVCLQAPPRDGDLEQHWRLEAIKPDK